MYLLFEAPRYFQKVICSILIVATVDISVYIGNVNFYAKYFCDDNNICNLVEKTVCESVSYLHTEHNCSIWIQWQCEQI